MTSGPIVGMVWQRFFFYFFTTYKLLSGKDALSKLVEKMLGETNPFIFSYGDYSLGDFCTESEETCVTV
jgi:hypothetical protein